MMPKCRRAVNRTWKRYRPRPILNHPSSVYKRRRIVRPMQSLRQIRDDGNSSMDCMNLFLDFLHKPPGDESIVISDHLSIINRNAYETNADVTEHLLALTWNRWMSRYEYSRTYMECDFDI